MKKILVLLTIFVSGTAFAQRGMGRGMDGYHHMGRGYSDVDNRGYSDMRGRGHHRSDSRGGYHMSMMENMPEAQRSQILTLREEYLVKRQAIENKYRTSALELELQLRQINSKFDQGFSLEQAKAMLQAQEIKMKLHDLHRKARNETDTLKMTMEQNCHKVYQTWINSL